MKSKVSASHLCLGLLQDHPGCIWNLQRDEPWSSTFVGEGSWNRMHKGNG